MKDEKKDNVKKKDNHKELQRNKKKEDRDFYKSWSKTRQAGIGKYVLNNNLKFSLFLIIFVVIYVEVLDDMAENRILNYIAMFIMGIIGYSISSLFKWKRNEKKYAQVSTRKQK